jgi:DNA-binding transcriptional MerR regulator
MTMTTTPTASTDPAAPARKLSIGQVSELTGLSVHTLRFYEDEGLFIEPIERDSGGRRLFTDLEVMWLGICTRLRTTGMPLAEIKRYAGMVRQGPGNEAERFELLRRHQAKVQADLDELTVSLGIITAKVDVYAAHLEDGSASALFTTDQDSCELPAHGAPVRR